MVSKAGELSSDRRLLTQTSILMTAVFADQVYEINANVIPADCNTENISNETASKLHRSPCTGAELVQKRLLKEGAIKP